MYCVKLSREFKTKFQALYLYVNMKIYQDGSEIFEKTLYYDQSSNKYWLLKALFDYLASKFQKINPDEYELCSETLEEFSNYLLVGLSKIIVKKAKLLYKRETYMTDAIYEFFWYFADLLDFLGIKNAARYSIEEELEDSEALLFESYFVPVVVKKGPSFEIIIEGKNYLVTLGSRRTLTRILEKAKETYRVSPLEAFAKGVYIPETCRDEFLAYVLFQ